MLCAHLRACCLAPDWKFFYLTLIDMGEKALVKTTESAMLGTICSLFSYRFFGKGLDIDVDVSSVVLIGGRLDVTLKVPGGGRCDP